MKTASGLDLSPVYITETTAAPAGAGRPWRIAARQPAPGVEVVIDPADLTDCTGLDAVDELRRAAAAPAGKVISIAVSADWLEEIAKLRALRHAAGGRTIHAYTQPGPETDPGNRLIRSTLGAMAAILGGADWIEMTPADLSEREARLAVRSLLVLREEAGLDDRAAAGAAAIEALRADLARLAAEEGVRPERRPAARIGAGGREER